MKLGGGKGSETAIKKRRYIAQVTLVFALAEVVFFYFLIWPNGLRTGRDFVGFILLLALSIVCGLVAAALSWRAVKAHLDK